MNTPEHLQLVGSCDLEAGAGEAPRRLAILAYGGGVMAPAGFGPLVIELTGMQLPQTLPVLGDHDASLGGIVGPGVPAIEAGRVMVRAGLVPGVTSERVLQLLSGGVALQASVGADIVESKRIAPGEKVTVNNRQVTAGKTGLLLVSKSVLKEVSITALGADASTSVNVAAKSGTRNGMNETENEGMDPVAAERQRAEAVARVAAGHPDILATALAEGWDANRTELQVLREGRPTARTTPGGRGRAPADGDALTASLLLSHGFAESQVGEWYGEQVMNAALSSPFKGMTLHGLIRHTIRAAGGHVPAGRIGDSDIAAAFRADRHIKAEFSTVGGLSDVLGNFANKALLAGYQAGANTWRAFVRQANDVKDFKPFARYRMTALGTFDPIPPDGEIRHAELTTEPYSNQLRTYGKMLALTRQMLINDDLGALLMVPRALGRMASVAVEKAVYVLLNSNPSSFFHANNNNLMTGAGSALSVTSLATAEQKFLDQVDENSDPVGTQPEVLLVPTTLKVTARQLIVDTFLNQVPASNAALPAGNPFRDQYRPVASPYLNNTAISGSSTTAWYLLAGPGDFAIMEVAFLQGKQTPTVETDETDFNTLGMQWRAYFDFGVAMLDPRGGVKANGA